MSGGSKERQKPFKVYVSAADRETILSRAAEAGMSTSRYLQIVGVNGEIRSAYDYAAVVELSKVNGDLGRLGELLKLWLTDQASGGVSADDVRRLYHDTKMLQQQVLHLMSRI